MSWDLLERYARKQTVESDTALVEEHLLICESCRTRLIYVDGLIASIRSPELPHPVECHDTEDGFVFLWVRPYEDGWLATVFGRTIETGGFCATRDAAIDYCRRTFSDLFPEHVCTPDCRPLAESGTG